MFETRYYRIELINIEDIGECRRLIIHGDYEHPWFAAIDIARNLGYNAARQSVYELTQSLDGSHIIHSFPMETIKSMKTPPEFKERRMVYRVNCIDVEGLYTFLLGCCKTDFYRKLIAKKCTEFKITKSLYSYDFIL